MLPSSFCEASITLILKAKIPQKKRKLQANIPDEQCCKNPQKSSVLAEYLNSMFNNTLKGLYTMIKWDLFHGCKDGSISTGQST